LTPCSLDGRLLQIAFIGRKFGGREADMIERHNPFIDFFDVFSCNLAVQQRSTQVLAAGAKE
jgi:hypothetical protein